MDAAQVKYAPSLYDPIITVSKKDSATIIVTMDTEVEGLTIHYSFDNSFPDNLYPAYKTALTVPAESAALKLVTYKGNKQMGRQMVITMAELKKRAGIK